MHEVLSNDETRRADQEAISTGIASTELMERAGRAVADTVMARFPIGHIVVLAGPGNNGGDGYVAARHLALGGRQVEVWAVVSPTSDDARWAASLWNGSTLAAAPDAADVLVDALFGSGLNRELPNEAIEALARFSSASLVAVDVPSGLNGDTGEIDRHTPFADVTVTFSRPKLGHLLVPGRSHTGELVVADIGITGAIVRDLDVKVQVNHPDLWLSDLPTIDEEDHKYTRGHAVVRSGPFHRTGAARLAAMAALRSGAGLVSVAGDEAAVRVNAEHLTTVMNKIVESTDEWEQLIGDPRVTAILIGPGNGIDDQTMGAVMSALATGKPTVLDADALTVFSDDPSPMFAVECPLVLTPHDGEFARIFAMQGSRVDRAVGAAEISGAVVVAKGPDTVIAEPSGRAVVATNGSPWLSTAGTGDVLAGIITGLLASGMAPFPAACAAVWMHAEAGNSLGRGLIAEDLPDALPRIWQRLG